MESIKTLHERYALSPAPASIKKRISRSGLGSFGLNDPLPGEVVSVLAEWYEFKDNGRPTPVDDRQEVSGPGQEGISPLAEELIRKNKEAREDLDRKLKEAQDKIRDLKEDLENQKNDFKAPREPIPQESPDIPDRVQNLREGGWREILAVLPLPMLGLAASYGVYFFASNFSPTWVAISEAASFELTYIGLAALRGLSPDQRKKATGVSIGAVAVSVLYNSIAAAIHQRPEILEDLPLYWLWIVSVIHGAPLAVLAYLVADLLFHRD